MSPMCSMCSDPIDEYADEAREVGRCCHNLPRPYRYNSSTGQYDTPLEGFTTDLDREEDEDEDRCDCEDCRWERAELERGEIGAMEADDRERYINHVLDNFGRWALPNEFRPTEDDDS